MNRPKTPRNKEICKRYKKGEKLVKLAKEYNITKQRVHQLVKLCENV